MRRRDAELQCETQRPSGRHPSLASLKYRGVREAHEREGGGGGGARRAQKNMDLTIFVLKSLVLPTAVTS